MHPYSALTPEVVLDAVAALGMRPDGRLLALSSYENRVYQVWLEDDGPVVAKFYRPGRWSEAQIEEEHAFARELAEREIPVVAPSHTGKFSDFIYAVYPRRGGRSPELELALDQYHRRGRLPFLEEMPLAVQEFSALLEALGHVAGIGALSLSTDPREGEAERRRFEANAGAALRSVPPYGEWLRQVLAG